jgi:lysyl-tRNA synthetase, class II
MVIWKLILINSPRSNSIKSLSVIGGVPEAIVNDKEAILAFLKSKNLEANSAMNLGQLQGELFDEFVEAKLINPTFITHYPVEISPLHAATMNVLN